MRYSTLALWIEQFHWIASARNFMRAIALRVRRREHQIAEALRNERLESSALRSLAVVTLPSLLVAIAAFAAIAWLQMALDRLGWAVVPDVLAEVYSDILMGVAGMGGVFIGLYYAAISAIATRSYGDASPEVRFLLAADTTGRAYMKMLVFAACFSLVALGVYIANGYRAKVAAIAALTLGALAVAAFVQLGNRAFRLFDPSIFSRDVIRDFVRCVDRVTRSAARSNQPEFQRHSRALAERALRTLDLMFPIAREEVLQRVRVIPDVCAALCGAQLHYISRKSQIPLDSMWFPDTIVQRRWFTTSDTITSIAAQTGTALQPDSRKDIVWVENRMDSFLRRLTTSIATRDNFGELQSCIVVIADRMQRRAALGDVVGAVTAWKSLSKDIVDALLREASMGFKRLEAIAIVDSLASIPVSISLGLTDYLDAWTIDKLTAVTAVVERGGALRHTAGEYPSHLSERIGWLVERSAYEHLSEGQQKTPRWYHNELIRHAEANHLNDALEALLSDVPNTYESLGNVVRGKENGLLEAAFLAREMEYQSKTEASSDAALRRLNELSPERRVDGLLWPQREADKVNKDLSGLESRLLYRMVPLALILLDVPDDEQIPDYGGRFLAQMADASFSAITAGDVARLKTIFPSMAAASMQLAQRLLSGMDNASSLTPKQHAAVAVVAQLLDISGYASVFSEIHQKPDMWDVVKAALDSHFSGNRVQSAAFIKGVIGLSAWGSPIGIPHMSIYRQHRRAELSRRLSSFRTSGDDSYLDDVPINHDSPIVRMMGRGTGFGPEGLDLFALVYLHDVLGVSIRELGYRVRELDRQRQGEGRDGDEDL